MTKRQDSRSMELNAINHLCKRFGARKNGLTETLNEAIDWHKETDKQSAMIWFEPEWEDYLKEYETEIEEVRQYILKKNRFIPDASKFTLKKLQHHKQTIVGVIQLFEVVNTHKISELKMNNIELLSLKLFDLCGLFIELFTTDDDGTRPRKVFSTAKDVVFPCVVLTKK